MTMNVQPVGTAVYSAPVPQERKTGGVGKGVASALIPGLGQFIDGRTGPGAAFFGAGVSMFLARLVLLNKYGIFNKKVIIPSCIAGVILSVASAVDAYIGDRGKTQQKNLNTNA